MAKKIVSTTVMFWLAIVTLSTLVGCKKDNTFFDKRKGTEAEVNLKLLKEDYPFLPGDVVLLKPDNHRAVIVNYRPLDNEGLYRVKYDSTGKKYTEKKLIRITYLAYKVRYVVEQEHRKSHIFLEDEPTEILHYKEANVNWYEISGKAEQK